MASWGRCDLCSSAREHERYRRQLCAQFDREYREAKRERDKLEALWREVCWYNFETRCHRWGAPWHETMASSVISLSSWYTGSISKAPALPPDIVLSELRAAQAAVRAADVQRNAPHDYAPGGRKYEALLREGVGAKTYEGLRTLSKQGAW